MAHELATAFVSLIPTTKNLQANTAKALSGVVPVAGKTGETMGSHLVSGVKKTAKGGLLLAGGVLATALYKGFQRTTQIENAEKKLEGLGHTTKTVGKIMTNALASVKGTAFGLDEAATVAASVVAAGVKPGKNLEKTLKSVADAATIGGTSLGEMGAIFSKVASSNKVQGDVINQLNAVGIPIVQLLGKALGKSSQEIYDMSRKGQISFKDFEKAMDSLKGSALKSGDTTTGAWKNTMAALSRFGQALLAGIFPSFKKGLGGMIGLIDKATVAVGPFALAVGKKLGARLEKAVAWLSKLDLSKLQGFWRTLKEGGSSSALGQIGSGFQAIFGAGKGLMEILPKLGGAFGALAGAAITILTKALGFIADHMDVIIKFLPAIIAGVLAWKIASSALAVSQTRLMLVQAAMAPVFLASNILRVAAVRGEQRLAAATVQTTVAETHGTAMRSRGIIVLAAQKAATIAQTVATKLATGAQKLFNLVLRANPIGIVITVLAALTAGMVWFFTKTQTGQKIVKIAWAAIKSVISGVTNWFKNTAVPWIRAGIDKVTTKFKLIGSVVKAVYEVGVRKPVNAMITLVKTTLPNAFKRGVDWISNIWKRIKRIAAVPINFLINTVYTNGIKAVFDKVAKAVGLKTRLPKVSPIGGYAKGGKVKEKWYLAGEEGPELIHRGSESHRVYTAAQTAAAMGTVPNPAALRAAAGNSPAEATLPMGGFWDDTKKNLKAFGIGIQAAIGAKQGQTVRDVKAITGWVRGNLANAASAILNPLVGTIDRMLPKNMLGDIGRGAAGKAVSSLADWIRGKDNDGGGFGNGAGGSFGGGYDGPLGKFRRPASGPFTSMFGPRWGGFHAGVDIAGNGPTFAALNGIVEKIGWNILPGVTGIGILLRHSKMLETYYGHNPSLASVVVRPGQQVHAGQHIGHQGQTGNATGNHLHFGVRKNGRWVNPMTTLFDNGGLLPPGINLVENRTRKPEPLANLDRLGTGDTIHIGQITIPAGDLAELKEITDFIDNLRRRARQK
jgi:tape measure domain-containing protein